MNINQNLPDNTLGVKYCCPLKWGNGWGIKRVTVYCFKKS